jgi:hypothetical protein
MEEVTQYGRYRFFTDRVNGILRLSHTSCCQPLNSHWYFGGAECLYLHLQVKQSRKQDIPYRQFQYQSLLVRMHQTLTMQPYWTQLTAQHKIITMHPISLATFTTTEFNKIFLGRQPHQGVKVLQRCSGWLCPESVPEMLENFYTLKRLSAWEDFIEPCVLIKAPHLWLLMKSPVWNGLTLPSTVAPTYHLL